jgi:hypothetical protein
VMFVCETWNSSVCRLTYIREDKHIHDLSRTHACHLTTTALYYTTS